MQRVMLGAVVAMFFVCGAGWCAAQEPGSHHEHLKLLDPLVGSWKVVTTEGDHTVSVGAESSEWLLNKNFMRHEGWWEWKGVPTRYEIITGWNPKEKKVFQWGFGGNASGCAHEYRSGEFDAERKQCLLSAKGRLSSGVPFSQTLQINLADDDQVTIDFRDRRTGDKTEPDSRDTFSRETVAAPLFDEQPGPGYEHLKAIEWRVGQWKITGQWPDGTPHEGWECAEWAFNKNFIRGTGWWTGPDGQKIDYLFVTAWTPSVQKIISCFAISGGGSSIRIGEYDAATKTLESQQRDVLPTGEESTLDQRTRWVDDDTLEWNATNIQGRTLPAKEVTLRFSRIK